MNIVDEEQRSHSLSGASVVVVYFMMAALACGDDKDSAQLQADQVNASIDGVNQSYKDYIETFCTCNTALSGKDLQVCIDESLGSPLELSDSHRVATTCDSNSYIAFQNCQRDAYKTVADCIESCPNTATHNECTNTNKNLFHFALL